MASKIILGTRPKTFKPFPVKFEMPDGSEGIINATFRYETKKEFGKRLDAISAAEKEKASTVVSDGKVSFSWEAFLSSSIEATAAHVLDGLASWDLDIPVSKESMEQMGDEIPAALAALAAAWASACREGRLGN